ncbi:MAG TPA: c-type cytochrome [Dokdonella sp.]
MIVLTAVLAAGSALAQTPPAAQPESSTPASKPNPNGAADANQPTAPTPPSTATTTPTAPPQNAVVLGDAKAGEAKAAACGACHGVDGNPSDKQYPKLAGQNEAFIARQLALFKSQKRQNPIMVGFAAPLSEQDMHDVGAYFATKASLPGVADDKLVERGQALYRGGDAKLGVPACMACHGPDGRGMAGAGFPQLGGQWADYVTAKLKDWKNGTTWGDDAKAQIMPAIAKSLGDADIAALASYVEGLHAAGAGTATAAK